MATKQSLPDNRVDMTERSIVRLECLKLARPDGITRPDVGEWVERAGKLEEYVLGDRDKAEEPPIKRRPGRPRKNPLPEEAMEVSV